MRYYGNNRRHTTTLTADERCPQFNVKVGVFLRLEKKDKVFRKLFRNTMHYYYFLNNYFKAFSPIVLI